MQQAPPLAVGRQFFQSRPRAQLLSRGRGPPSCDLELGDRVARARSRMSADAEPGKRKRAAVARHDADYAYADDPDDYEEEKASKRKAPAPKPKPAAKPPPVIKLTVTQPLAQELTKEEARLLEKYANLRALQQERRNPAEQESAENKPASASDEAVRAALKEAYGDGEEASARPKKTAGGRRPGQQFPPPARAKAERPPARSSSPSYAAEDD